MKITGEAWTSFYERKVAMWVGEKVITPAQIASLCSTYVELGEKAALIKLKHFINKVAVR